MDDVRERLLDAAEALIYQRGIHATGIDTILAAARAAKMSLYGHFDGKDALVLAMLERRHQRWLGWLTARVKALRGRAGGAVPAIFRALGEWFASENFHGCAFVNSAAEYGDPDHPVRRLAARHKADLARIIAQHCRDAGHPDIARAVALLVEGAIATALVSGRAGAARDAEAAARRLIAGKPRPAS